jgi:predicted nucleotidyltransferase
VTDFEKLLRVLNEGGVESIVIGGLAATIHGSARLTQDVDVAYARSSANLDRLVEALEPLNPYPRGAPPGLPFDWSVVTLQSGLNFTLMTSSGPLDLFGEVLGGGTYEDLLPHTVHVHLFGQDVTCLDIEAVIRTKRAAGRPRDFEAIAELEALREERKT